MVLCALLNFSRRAISNAGALYFHVLYVLSCIVLYCMVLYKNKLQMFPVNWSYTRFLSTKDNKPHPTSTTHEKHAQTWTAFHHLTIKPRKRTSRSFGRCPRFRPLTQPRFFRCRPRFVRSLPAIGEKLCSKLSPPLSPSAPVFKPPNCSRLTQALTCFSATGDTPIVSLLVRQRRKRLEVNGVEDVNGIAPTGEPSVNIDKQCWFNYYYFVILHVLSANI